MENLRCEEGEMMSVDKEKEQDREEEKEE